LLTLQTASGQWTKLQYGKFTDAGSVCAIRTHFPVLPWEMATLGVFEDLLAEKIEAVDPLQSGEDFASAFLGEVSFICMLPSHLTSGVQGGMGRVFCAVRREENQEMAVKVVLHKDVASLECEYRILSNAAAGLPLVRPCSQFVSGDFGAGYAMQPRGSGHALVADLLKARHRTTLLEEAFTTLSTLHKAKLTHRDARLSNLIITIRGPVWADLMRTVGIGGQHGFAADMETLAESVLGVKLDQAVRQAALAYGARVVAQEERKGGQEERKEERVEALKVDAASIVSILGSLPA
jgi:hypothetical protein